MSSKESRYIRRLRVCLFCAFILSLMLITDPAPIHADSALLNDAKSALFNGDYQRALALYTSASTDNASKCDALYGIGVTNLRAEAFDVAESAFTRALTECKPTFRSYVLRGDVRRTLKKRADALADYRNALALQPGLIDSYLYERMATISDDQALTYLLKSAEAPRPVGDQVTIRKRLVTIFKALGDTATLQREYESILTVALSPADLAEAEEALGELQIENGEPAKGYAHLQHVLTTYPTLRPAFDALVTLVTAGQEVDLVLRSRVNVANQNYRPVINRLADPLASANPDNTPAELYVLLAKAYRGLEQYPAAIDSFQKVRDRYPKDAMASVAALEQGITYETQSDTPNALKYYSDTATTYPASPEAPRALYRSARLQQASGHTPEAVVLYDQLGKQYPGTDLASAGLFNAGMLVAPTDPARAADLFSRTGTTEGLLWQGLMLQTAKDANGAQKAWIAAAAKDSDGFFGLRAQELLAVTPPFRPPDAVKIPQETDADAAAAAAWVKNTFKLSSVLLTLPPDLAQNSTLRRATELWELGWWKEANAEFDDLYALHRDDAGGLLPLAVNYKNIGAYRASILAASRLYILSGAPASQVPPFILRLTYPIYYADLLLPAAQAEGVDPLLVATIIRTESRFDPHATSPTTDKGLTQMLPSTAKQVAGQVGIPNFSDRDLYRPMISIRLASHYIASLKTSLNNMALVVVGYNAGAGYASKTFAAAGNDIDRFYQLIDIDSVQTYLSYNYEEYAVYRQLYH